MKRVEVMTPAQYRHLSRMERGDSVEVWWEAGGTRWHWAIEEEERPHWVVVSSLVTRGWAYQVTYGRNIKSRVLERDGHRRAVSEYRITNKGRRAARLAITT
jgi:hypothetical protein